MITGYKPNTEHVLEYMLGICHHSFAEGVVPPFCTKCNAHIPESEIKRIMDLERALENKEGGYTDSHYISVLLNFLSKYGTLTFKYNNSVKWHAFCYTMYRGKEAIIYHTKSNEGFAYNICWLSEIAFRALLERGQTEDQLRSIIR